LQPQFFRFASISPDIAPVPPESIYRDEEDIMRAIISVLAAAGCSAVLLCATSARADEGHRDREHTEAPVEAARFDRADWFRIDRDRHDDQDRRADEIERARERFYASWDGNQRARARFDAWYSHECAQLGR
jgi:hypothetical protein